jgi:hypothetical protein
MRHENPLDRQLVAARYSVMEAHPNARGGGLIGAPYVVVDLERQRVESRHQTPEAARRRADQLVAAERRAPLERLGRDGRAAAMDRRLWLLTGGLSRQPVQQSTRQASR